LCEAKRTKKEQNTKGSNSCDIHQVAKYCLKLVISCLMAE